MSRYGAQLDGWRRVASFSPPGSVAVDDPACVGSVFEHMSLESSLLWHTINTMKVRQARLLGLTLGIGCDCGYCLQRMPCGSHDQLSPLSYVWLSCCCWLPITALCCLQVGCFMVWLLSNNSGAGLCPHQNDIARLAAQLAALHIALLGPLQQLQRSITWVCWDGRTGKGKGTPTATTTATAIIWWGHMWLCISSRAARDLPCLQHKLHLAALPA